MSSSSLMLLFFLLHTCAAISPAAAQLDLWTYQCSDDNNTYTANSTYKTNLNKLLTKISTADIPYGFYNFSAGLDPDQVNAIALCRGDINVIECHTCLDFAISKLTSLCPIQVEAIGWAEKCMIRYSSDSIFGLWAESPFSNLVTGVTVTADVNHFANVVTDLLTTLPNKTAGGDSQLKFATGEAQVNASMKVYALMQCTPDLPTTDCLGCLYWVMYYALEPDRGQTGAQVLVPSCSVRYDSQKFYAGPPSQGGKAAAAIPSSPDRSGTGSAKSNFVIIVVLGVLASLSLLVNFCTFCFLKRRTVYNKMLSKFDGGEEASRIESLEMDFSTIRDATQKFSATNLLGCGGFGVVYKGTLDSGEQIAVKRLACYSRQSHKEFENEVRLAAKLQHRNLVKLLGFCLKGEERLLIFEFVSNGSLDYMLFDEEKRVQLDWETRFLIIEGISRGLLYLHEDSRYKIVHRDLKPANVLLDEDLRPKITDFGTARLFPPNLSRANTERAAGTISYMAPEYFLEGLVSVKSDVYSFGIMVLEIVAGRSNIIPTPNPEETSESLINLALRNWSNGTVLNIVDPAIALAGSKSQIRRCIHIALLCVQESAESRPTMYSVNQMLAAQSSDLPYPSQLHLDADSLLQSTPVVSLEPSTDLYPR